MRFLVPLLLATTFALHADDAVRTLIKSGSAHEEAGRLAEAARDYEAARAAAERAGNREGVGEALILLGYLQYYRGEMNDALVNLQRGYDVTRELGDEQGQRIALAYIAHVYADAKDACRTAPRPGDVIGRTGGEEFMALLPSTTERDAIAVAERLRAAVEALDCSDVDPSLRVTISLGVAEWSAGDVLERLAARADEVLYRAKETGRNRVVAAAVA